MSITATPNPAASPPRIDVAVSSSGGTETFVSSTVQLDPAWPWLIHPTTPALSRPLDQGVFSTMGVVSHGAVSRSAEAAVAHAIIGAKHRQVTVSGPRSASQTQLVIATVTAEEQRALWAMVEDLTPLLIRVPGAWGWDWEDGYYQVGQVDADRFAQYGPERRRTFTFPLERVESPAGGQAAQWTCAGLLAAFGSSAAVVAAYASGTDLLTDTRR